MPREQRLAHVVPEIETNESVGYLQHSKERMAEGSWLCGAEWEETAVDSMWYCISSMLDRRGLIFLVSYSNDLPLFRSSCGCHLQVLLGVVVPNPSVLLWFNRVDEK